MAQIGATWVSTSWVSSGGWADGTWGASTGEDGVTTGAGSRYGRGRKRREAFVTQGRTVPVSDTLYKQMFPPPAVESTTVEPADAALPVALLMAFMAIDQ